MRIAIIGSGISGMVAARELHSDHDLTILEANDYVGGHTNTVTVELDGEQYSVDTGFIVFNDRTYPNFCRLLDDLGVESQPSTMSFSVRSDADDLEYNGSSLNGLFCQRRNLLRPSFYRMIKDILRFNREAPKDIDRTSEETTVGDYLRTNGYSQQFAANYLLPMGAAIWSCPTTTFEQFPVRFIIEFYQNHGLLSLKDRPTWRVINGGSVNYMNALTASFRDRIRLKSPVRQVVRDNGSVQVGTDDGTEAFDEVIFACHSDQALRILGNDATTSEREILGAIPYEPNLAVLHTDTSLLPRRRSAWASWNYHVPSGSGSKATLTYNMNILQHINSQHTFCVTLNEETQISPEKVLGKFHYSHPVFTTERASAQRRHQEVIRHNRTSFCGAYWGNGFHEDGVNSGLAVASAFQPKAVRESSGVPANA